MRLLIVYSGHLSVDLACTLPFYHITTDDDDSMLIEYALAHSSSGLVTDELRNRGLKISLARSEKDSSAAFYIKLLRLIRQNKYDAVYVHGTDASMSVSLLAAWLGGTKLRIAHAHYDEFPTRSGRIPFSGCYTRAIACCQEVGRSLFIKPFLVIKDGVVLEDAVYNQARRDAWRSALGLENKLVIGQIGRFDEANNQDFSMDVLHILRKTHPEAHLLLVGEGDMRGELISRAAYENLESHTTIPGETASIGNMLQVMDIFLLPSLRFMSPGLLAAAQISGLPCIASDAVPAEAALTKYSLCLLPLNISVWADKIENSLSYDRKSASAAAAEKARQNSYDISVIAKQIRNLY